MAAPTSIVILAALELADTDRDRIDAIRVRHDPQHRIVGPHVTLVFPCTGVAIDDVVPHTKVVTAANRRIDFHLRSAIAEQDRLSPASHVFLMPDRPEAIVALHHRLYAGPLAGKRLADLRYAPHVTVGRFDSLPRATELSGDLNAGGIDIPAAIATIQVATYDGHQLHTIARLPLA